MNNIAILAGNSEYKHLNPLACCLNDVEKIYQILNLSEKYQKIHKIKNKTSSETKDKIREIIEESGKIDEILFYFTGHGYFNQDDFYYCPSDFEIKRPNETGISNDELHILIKPAKPELIVKIIDACNSGNQLIKGDAFSIKNTSYDIKNIIQIASCLSSQSSLAGIPLSFFTHHFVEATVSKSEGAVYYTDIIASLRDKFLENEFQTPHFTSQGTGREQFIDDVRKLSSIRDELINEKIETDNILENTEIDIVDQLTKIEDSIANEEKSNKFISKIFSETNEKLKFNEKITKLYSINEKEYNDYYMDNCKKFIIQIINSEKLSDNLVTARRYWEKDGNRPWETTIGAFFGDPDAREKFQLSINCSLGTVQTVITLTPKFRTLKEIRLVISTIPSIKHCYVFENITFHSLTDWDRYSEHGNVVSQRWFRLGWNEDTSLTTAEICNNLNQEILDYIEKITNKMIEN
ncbi:caspase domain-containing protein [Thalassospira xianhensis]|uniref:Peptidase C14 caspase domain-containing protein n=1 Tax=Thalassospira xianhensis MCCC 1A02616 TaxID=1177929 RepID=A0A367U9P9_9PROT|nr:MULTISPECIES: caspase family protein [Thalassospira]MBO9509784.1 caspase family protein [Thalassospira sp. A3_1]RCK03762.1 hypothetical protein TH5_23530 [Thalassospira xianhensis MCCC 1A02616]